MHFLIKLDDHFGQVRTNILMMDQLPTISQANRLLLQEQYHKELSKFHTSIVNSMAFHFAHTTPHNKPSNKNQISGNKRTSHYFYDHCKVSGYFMERCFKIHGYPKHTKFHNQKVATIAST